MGSIPLGASVLTDIARNKTVNVESVNVFNDVRVGNIVKPISGTKYNFTKEVDLGQIQFVFENGSEAEFSSDNLISNTIISGLTGTDALFSGDVGRLIIRDVDITMSDGRWFNINATTNIAPLVQVQNGIFQGGNDIGEIKGALFLLRQTGIFNWNNGIVLDDNGIVENTGVQIQNTLFISVGGTQVTIRGDQSLIIVNANLTTPNNGESFLNLESNMVILENGDIDALSVTNNVIDNVLGGGFLAAGSLDSTSPGTFFFNNNSSLDSYTLGSISLTGGTTETVLSDTSTFVIPAGVYSAGFLERYEVSTNRLKYLGIRPRRINIIASMQILMNPTLEEDIIEMAVFKNGTEVSRVQQLLGAVFQVPTSPPFSICENVLAETGDLFDVRIRNITKAANVIATDLKLVMSNG